MTTTMFPWTLVDELTGGLTGYLQFPWRLLMATDLLFALGGGYGLTRLAGKKQDPALFGILALCLVMVMPMLSEETRKNHYVYYGRVSEQNLAYMDYTLEGTELSKTFDQTVHTTGDVEITAYQRAGTHVTARVSTEEGGEISLPFFGFDGYAAEVEGREMAVGLGENNRLTVHLPAGTEGTLRIWFAGKGYWRFFDAVSLAALAGLAGRRIWKMQKRRKRQVSAAH